LDSAFTHSTSILTKPHPYHTNLISNPNPQQNDTIDPSDPLSPQKPPSSTPSPTPIGARGGAEARLVLQESESEVAAALELVEALTRSHPSLPAWLRSKQAALEVLTEQHGFLQQLSDAGAWVCCGVVCRGWIGFGWFEGFLLLQFAAFCLTTFQLKHISNSLTHPLQTQTQTRPLQALTPATPTPTHTNPNPNPYNPNPYPYNPTPKNPTGLVNPREMLLLDDMMHSRFRDLLRSNTGVAAALHYSKSRPPLNVLPLFDSLSDEEAAELMQRQPRAKVGAAESEEC